MWFIGIEVKQWILDLSLFFLFFSQLAKGKELTSN